MYLMLIVMYIVHVHVSKVVGKAAMTLANVTCEFFNITCTVISRVLCSLCMHLYCIYVYLKIITLNLNGLL